MSACQHCGREHPAGSSKCPVTGDSMQGAGPIGLMLAGGGCCTRLAIVGAEADQPASTD